MRHVSILWTAAFLIAASACSGEDGAPGDPGDPGESCTVVDNGDGTKTITCGDVSVDVTDGIDGTDGAGCTAVDNGDGTFTITCGDDVIVVTDPNYVPPAYAAADGIAGGTAYAKWWLTQADGPGTLAAAGVTVGSEWVRCKTCHAWDGLGNAASYANRTGQSTGTAARPDVSTVDLRATVAATTPLQLFDLIKGTGGRPLNTEGNGHPDFSTALTDAQLWNLVKFMREDWIYPDALYYLAVNGPPVYKDAVGTVIAPTLTYYGIGVDGDPTNGATVYTASCSTCHGANGTQLDIAGASLGELVRTKPHEVWHKAKFGEIDNSSTSIMDPGLVVDTGDIVDLYSALANAANYPDI